MTVHTPKTATLAPLGPDSLAWRLVGDWRVLLVLGRGLLLQTMHPVVGAGVADHSVFQSDPWGRLDRSLMPIVGAVYDGPVAAQTGRDIRAMHKTIKGVDAQGRSYHAMDPDAYFWVHATIFESLVKTHELFGRPLSWDEQTAFYAEWRVVGRTVGLREKDMPGDLPSFYAYYDRMLAERLEDHATAHDVVTTAYSAPPPPGWRGGPRLWSQVWSRVAPVAVHLTIGSLPQSARERLGYTWTARDERKFRRYAALVRVLGNLVPRRYRYLPRAQAGFAREGRPRS